MAASNEKEALLGDSSKSLSPLQSAILEGDTTRLNQLVDKQDSEVNHVDAQGDTPLFTAVNKGNVEATEALLQHGAKVNVLNKEGDTVLHVAAREDRSTILPLLLKKTDDVGQLNTQGEAPVHLAVVRGHLTIVSHLCKVGADINLPLNQSTPLHLAIINKQTKVAEQLIANGAKLDIEDENGNVPLHLAANMTLLDAEVLKIIVKKDEDMMWKKNNDGNTPLHVAAVGGHYKQAMFMIDHGSPLMSKNNDGDTPLHLAAEKGYAVSAALYVKKDRQTCNVVNNDGHLPIHKAVMNGGTKAVAMLLDLYESDENLWQGFLAKDEAVEGGLMDLAIDNDHQSVAKVLAESKKWKTFMTTTKMVDDDHRRTPMLRLIEDMPEVAKIIMDQCLSVKDSKHIIADFELLDDRFCSWGMEKRKTEAAEKKLITDDDCEDGPHVDFSEKPFTNDVCILKRSHPMNALADTENTFLLDHPLVRILVRRKWGRTALIYFSFLAYYGFFISLMCVYMSCSVPPLGRDLCGNNTGDEAGEVYSAPGQVTVRIFIYICVVIGLATELSQIALTRLKHYLDAHNLCDWFTYVSPLLIVSSFSECGAMMDWQYQLGIVCIFMSCMNLIYFIRIVPSLGIYVMMVMLMLRNFMQFFTIMFLFIIAFGLCFFLLLQNQLAFSTPFFSIMKNWVMMVGEMDFTDGYHGHRETNDPGVQMYYEPLTWLLYVMFLVFLSLIIMNLLTSLAVSGVESLQEDSKYCMISLQIKIALNVEFSFPVWLQHRLRSVVRYQQLKTCTKRNKALGQLQKSIQLVVYGDLCKEDIVKEALQIIQERQEDGIKKEVKKPLTKKDIETVIFNKTKDMRLAMKDIDRNIEDVEKRLQSVEELVGDIHSMLVKLVDGK